MEDDHLMNTIKLLRRAGQAHLWERIHELAAFSSHLGGEMAQYYADQEMGAIAEETWVDQFPGGTVEILITEAERRGLEVPNGY